MQRAKRYIGTQGRQKGDWREVTGNVISTPSRSQARREQKTVRVLIIHRSVGSLLLGVQRCAGSGGWSPIAPPHHFRGGRCQGPAVVGVPGSAQACSGSWERGQGAGGGLDKAQLRLGIWQGASGAGDTFIAPGWRALEVCSLRCLAGQD